MHVMQKADHKYLHREAEPEARIAIPARTYGHALVIPAYGEGDNLLRTLGSVPSGPRGDVLIVLVVNARADAPAEMHAANQALLARLRDTYPLVRGESVLSTTPSMTLYDHPRGTLLLIERSHAPCFLPDGQGVGLARKIGTDVAWAFHLAGKVASPWLHGTDADVVLPPDYFSLDGDVLPPASGPLGGTGRPAALIHPFDHLCDADDAGLADAMRRYEIWLRYYVLGLAWAGSPYAFHTIGSTIAVDAGAYARVRGYPRRSAGEDFYFLNKLAKVGSVVTLSGEGREPIRIDGRASGRVPFGTGRALGVLRSGVVDGADYRLYHPRVFGALACWLRVLARWPLPGDVRDAVTSEAAAHDVDGDALVSVLEGMNAFAAVDEAAARPGGADAFRRHIHTWFDGFRTLRFMHEMRDRFEPSPPLREALRLSTHLPWAPPLADAELETLRQRFAHQEGVRFRGGGGGGGRF